MSSPSASRRAQRSRQSATPKQSNRSSRPVPSSPLAGSGADNQLLSEASEASQRQNSPRIRTNANQQRAADSSPMLFRSSPAAADLRSDGPNRSSPPVQDANMTDGDRTPRASGANFGESSPIRYASSSVAGNLRSDNLRSSSSALFVQPTTGEIPPSSARQRRHDIQSDILTSGSGRRRRIFVDENGVAVGNGDAPSDANTFSNLDPTTSDAEILGGNTNRIVWGTNISIADCRHACHEFLMNFQRKYRLAIDGEIAENVTLPSDHPGHSKEYLEMMKTMLDLGVTALNLDVRNLKAYPPTRKLWHQLIGFPSDIIPIIDLCIKDCMLELAYEKGQQEERRMRHLQRNAGASTSGQAANAAGSDVNGNGPARTDGTTTREAEPKSELEKEVLEKIYRVRPFGLDNSINLRELNPSDMDKLVSIKGLIIRTTPIIPDMKDAFFRCSVCNHCVQVDIDRGKITEPTRCPRVACESVNSMQIIHNRSGFADKQVIKLQETPDNIPDGQTPHSVSVCAYDDLVDVCKAGDRVEITGIFKCNQVRINPRQRTVKNIFKTYVDALHIQKVDRKRLGVDVSTIEEELSDQVVGDIEQARKFTEAEEKKIKETAARKDIYELLSRSLAPSIYEMDDVKKGILLQLFGGTNKSFQKGGNPKYRGDINILLCGDPSTSKSQLLQYVHKIAPRGVYTSGKGSSAVGLTAYVTRDPETRQLVLESGALVLSDGGVCCIDEFDKMSDSTRSVLHEVMEQQTVSIAKAGIITTLNARTSILASANPIGSKYNPKIPVPQNIDLPPTLLSRFDLVYLVLDRVDEQNDRRLARHLLGMYLEDTPENASREEILPIEFLTSYISYARSYSSPVLTEEASSALIEAYVAMRGLGADVRAAERRITATTRQLESMIRLAEAHAKMRLSPVVSSADVAEAVRLIQSALKQAATDSRTGLIDMGLLTEGTSASERRRLADLKNAVVGALDDLARGGETVRVADLYRKVADGSSIAVEGAEIADALKSLEAEGLVQVSGEGQRRTVRRLRGIV